MSTATVSAPVAAEPVAEVINEKEVKTRGRKKGQKLFNHDQIHTSKETAEENAPYYSQEVVKKQKEMKDGKEVEVEITEYEGEEEADGFRLYMTKINEELLKAIPHNAYVWGRNGDNALATFCSQFCEADLVDAKPRGRAKKIDGIYVMFFISLIEQGKTKELVETLKEQEILHYIDEPRISAALKAKGVDPATIAA